MERDEYFRYGRLSRLDWMTCYCSNAFVGVEGGNSLCEYLADDVAFDVGESPLDSVVFEG